MLPESEVAERLRASGRRVTATRLLVYRLLQEIGGHVTADDVLSRAQVRGDRLTLPTVYASLHALVEIGAARIAYLQPGGALTFDARTENHHHLVCRSCGAVEESDCAIGETPCLTPEAASGYQIERAEVTYVGLCPRCAVRGHLKH